MPTSFLQKMVFVMYVLGLILFGVSIYQFIAALSIAKKTEILSVQTPLASSVLSVRSTKSLPKNVGTGSVKLRLDPGEYIIGVNANGMSAEKTIQLKKGSPQKISVNPSATEKPALTSSTVSFQNTDRLTYYGLQNKQLETVKKSFIMFNPNANTVVIQRTSVTRDPIYNNTIWFNLRFLVDVNNKPYKAVITYDGDSAVLLTLYDSATGEQVYPVPDSE